MIILFWILPLLLGTVTFYIYGRNKYKNVFPITFLVALSGVIPFMSIISGILILTFKKQDCSLG